MHVKSDHVDISIVSTYNDVDETCGEERAHCGHKTILECASAEDKDVFKNEERDDCIDHQACLVSDRALAQ